MRVPGCQHSSPKTLQVGVREHHVNYLIAQALSAVRLQDEHVGEVVEGGVAATSRANSASSSSANKPKVSEFSTERLTARTGMPEEAH
jgi:hypothetical protein